MNATRRQLLIGAASATVMCAADEPVRVIRVPDQGIQPQAAISGQILSLIYFKGDPKGGDVFLARSNDFGVTFSVPIRVNSRPGSAIAIGTIRGAQMSLGSSGRAHVAWNGADGKEMLYARLNAEGTAFEPQRNVMLKTSGLDGGGSVASDQDGNVYVAWQGKEPDAPEGEAGRAVWIAQSTDHGLTFAQERAASEGTGACGCCGLRVFADSDDAVYGLYRSATQDVHRDIYLLRSSDKGRTFSTARLHEWNVNACPMSSMSIIEAGHEVLGGWETQTQVYFAPLGRGGDAAKAAMISPAGSNPKRKHPALARNNRGETLLAWVEGSGWQRGGKLGWQIFDRIGKPLAASRPEQAVPVWSFPAAFACPDGRFTILV